MIKIFMTVRNRLAVTKKAIRAMQKHTTVPYQLFVYDNATNYRVEEHFSYFSKLYQRGDVAQVTFTTTDSTFNAFSKASTCNFFGLQHEQDPKKHSYEFLLLIDNDIILTPEWDVKLKQAWSFVSKNKMNHIKVIGQLPGGIKNRVDSLKIGNMTGRTGKLGGSGLWSVRPNFFTDVGMLNLNSLVGHDKKHDQQYWQLLARASGGKPYIMGINEKLGIHCGRMAGSVCNKLTKHKTDKNIDEIIMFKDAEKRIDDLDFDEFYKKIINDRFLVKDW